MNALRLYLFAHYLGLGAVLPLLSIGFEARGFRPTQYAWLLVLIPVTRLFAPPLWGVLADRYLGALKLLRANTALTATAMLALFVAEDLVTTVAAFGAWALVSSSLVPLIEASAYRLLGARASSFGHVRVFGSIGFASSALALGLTGVDAEVRAPFAVAAFAYALASLSTFGVRDAAVPTRAPLRHAVKTLARRSDVALLWLAATFYYVAHGAFDTYFGPYARTLRGATTATVSAAWSIGVVTEVLVLWLVPRWLETRARPYLLVASGLTAALRWGLLALAQSDLHLLLLAPLHGITFGAWYLAFVHENQARADVTIRATVQGVAQACIGAGMVAATLLGGYVLERAGGRVLFAGAAACALVAATLYAFREWLLLRASPRLASFSSEP